MFVLHLQFCIMYIVLGGRADKGENHPLFLEPSEQLRFSDQSLTVCGPNFTSFAVASSTREISEAPYPILPLSSALLRLFMRYTIWSRQSSSQLLVLNRPLCASGRILQVPY